MGVHILLVVPGHCHAHQHKGHLPALWKSCYLLSPPGIWPSKAWVAIPPALQDVILWSLWKGCVWEKCIALRVYQTLHCTGCRDSYSFAAYLKGAVWDATMSLGTMVWRNHNITKLAQECYPEAKELKLQYQGAESVLTCNLSPPCKQENLLSSSRTLNFSMSCIMYERAYTNTTVYLRTPENHCTNLGIKSMQDGEC